MKNYKEYLDIGFVICTLVFQSMQQTPSATVRTDTYELTVFGARKSFTGAKQACETKGAHLVKIDEKSVTDVIEAHTTEPTGGSHGYWIGAVYNLSTGTWAWQDGSRVNLKDEEGYSKWREHEPNNLGTEHCAIIGRIGYGWNNIACSSSSYYICQRQLCIPTVVSIDPQPCNSSLRIRWKPIGIGNVHSISVSLEITGEEVFHRSLQPDTNETQELMINNLTSSTTYTIEIIGCSDQTTDMQEVVRANAVTGGIPNAVTSPGLSENCTISWSWPSITKRGIITGYQLIITSSLALTSHLTNVPSNQQQIINVSATTLSHPISMLPNRNYSVIVQARACAGLGRIAKANGSCVRGIAAPFDLSPLEISNKSNVDGTRKVILQIPSEENGPISCLFIIVKVGQSLNSARLNSIEELVSVNSPASGKIAFEYIALALRRTSIASSFNSTQVLGSNSTSRCDVLEVPQGRSQNTNKSLGIIGKDKPLVKDQTYRLYMVTTTPSGEEIFLQRSDTIVFENTYSLRVEENISETVWVVPVAIIASLTLIGFLVFILYKKETIRCGDKSSTLNDNGVGSDGIGMSMQPRSNENSLFTKTSSENRQYENVGNISAKPKKELIILMARFEDAFSTMSENNNQIFRQQFEAIILKSNPNKASTSVASDPVMVKKNRNQNVLPYDVTRVRIQQSETGYINASYIHGFKQDRKFIAAQSPLPTTVNDFWMMVVEQECRVIVMLAKCVEAGKKTCEKYWPDTKQTLQFGLVSVTGVEESTSSSYARRMFHVYFKNQVYDNPMTVYQYQFLKWPDHGVPPSAVNLVRMHQAVMQSQGVQHGNPPIIIHCSDGAGRSGTFIAYDLLLEESKAFSRVDVFSCVLGMRSQRMEMIQTCDQYVLVHKMLLDSCLLGANEIVSNEGLDKLYEEVK